MSGEIHGRQLEQTAYTDAQYKAMIRLTAALCDIFPKMRCDYPRNPDGSLLTTVMPEEDWQAFGGLVGHYHLTTNKIDPGPAFDFEYITSRAQEIIDRADRPR